MAIDKRQSGTCFDSEQVHKGDLIRAKHKTWDEYKSGLVVGITSNEPVVLYHTGIGNVSNHFVMLASAKWPAGNGGEPDGGHAGRTEHCTRRE